MLDKINYCEIKDYDFTIKPHEGLKLEGSYRNFPDMESKGYLFHNLSLNLGSQSYDVSLVFTYREYHKDEWKLCLDPSWTSDVNIKGAMGVPNIEGHALITIIHLLTKYASAMAADHRAGRIIRGMKKSI